MVIISHGNSGIINDALITRFMWALINLYYIMFVCIVVGIVRTIVAAFVNALTLA